MRVAIGCCGERGSAGNVGSDEERAALFIQWGSVEEFAPEACLRGGEWRLEQGRVGERNSRQKIEGGGWRIARQDFILTSESAS